MTAATKTAVQEAADILLNDLLTVADMALQHKGVARLIAADPARRGNMEQTRDQLAELIPRLREALPKLQAAHKFLSRTLRNVKPAVRA